MAKVLTVIKVERAIANGKRVEIPDGGLPGLYLVVQPGKAKSWACRYRFGGKTRKFSIGAYPKVDLVNARELARSAMRAIAEGRDPDLEKKKARRAPTSAPLTVEEVAERYLLRHARRENRERTWRETARILGFKVDAESPEKFVKTGNGVIAAWKGVAIAEIKREDVIELINQIVDRGSPKMANRTLAWIRRMFNWAESQNIKTCSPCDKVVMPASETKRKRKLNDDEIRILWHACDAVDQPFGPLTKLLILTVQRRAEVATMAKRELDLKARTWTIPREKNQERRRA